MSDVPQRPYFCSCHKTPCVCEPHDTPHPAYAGEERRKEQLNRIAWMITSEGLLYGGRRASDTVGGRAALAEIDRMRPVFEAADALERDGGHGTAAPNERLNALLAAVREARR